MATKTTALDLALQVERMRTVQTKYFKLARQPKAKKTAEDYEEQRALLKHSKELETAVDAAVNEIIMTNALGPGAVERKGL